jgi:hypothetical protein
MFVDREFLDIYLVQNGLVETRVWKQIDILMHDEFRSGRGNASIAGRRCTEDRFPAFHAKVLEAQSCAFPPEPLGIAFL